MNPMEDYLESREHFEFSYFLIGLLEVNLRTHVPDALKGGFQRNNSLNWYSNLQLNKQGENSLNLALQINRKNPENYLPFSFWRYLFSNRNYGTLWLPSLHTLFPGVSAPKTINSFKAVDKNMDTALRLRNNVAHFKITEVRNMRFSQERVKWLLINMGIADKLLIQRGQVT